MTAHVGAGNKIPDATLDEIITRVTRGAPVFVAAQLVGYTDRTVYRVARNSSGFRLRLDSALSAGRSRRLCGCGTLASYRRGCKCQACRAANNRRSAREAAA